MIGYKKGRKNKLDDLLLVPPTSKITTFGTLMHVEPFTCDAFKEAYSEDDNFREVFQQLLSQSHVDNGDNIFGYNI